MAHGQQMSVLQALFQMVQDLIFVQLLMEQLLLLLIQILGLGLMEQLVKVHPLHQFQTQALQ